MFNKDPHYHYEPPAGEERIIMIDTVAEGDAVTWGITRIRERLLPMLVAAGGQDLAPGADHQLGRAAADVAHHHLAVEHGHRLEDAQVDEPGLLEPRDDLDVDALGPGPLDEHGPVGRLPDHWAWRC